MENIEVINLSVTGNTTGRSYNGTFKAKTLLTRRDQFAADLKRREIIGSVAPDTAMPALVGEAFIIGQLSVRIIEAPDWWTQSAGGLDLQDANVSEDLFRHAVEAEQKAKDAIKQQAKEALTKLAASATK
jgi:hypothetical protein